PHGEHPTGWPTSIAGPVRHAARLFGWWWGEGVPGGYVVATTKLQVGSYLRVAQLTPDLRLHPRLQCVEQAERLARGTAAALADGAGDKPGCQARGARQQLVDGVEQLGPVLQVLGVERQVGWVGQPARSPHQFEV